jgi:hypothetical protein
MVFSFQSDGGSLYIPLPFKELKPLDVGHRILALNANYEFLLSNVERYRERRNVQGY